MFSAVAFLGERFTAVNALGLCILILGVALFNWTKYRKLKEVGDEGDEGDKAHPAPASRARYTMVDSSQVSETLKRKQGRFLLFGRCASLGTIALHSEAGHFPTLYRSSSARPETR